jgi:hypothetical protein
MRKQVHQGANLLGDAEVGDVGGDVAECLMMRQSRIQNKDQYKCHSTRATQRSVCQAQILTSEPAPVTLEPNPMIDPRESKALGIAVCARSCLILPSSHIIK